MAMSRPTYGKAWAPSEKFISKHWVGWNIAWCQIRCWCCTDLKGFDKSPEERSDAFSFTEQFHQPQNSEQAEECDGHFSTFTFALKQNEYSDKQKHGVDLYMLCRYYLVVAIYNMLCVVTLFSSLTSPWPPPPWQVIRTQQKGKPHEMKVTKVWFET